MKEYIITVDESKPDIIGSVPLMEPPNELIRCKDCRHYTPRKSVFSPDIQLFKCSILDTDTDPNWFCACGERME